MTIFTNEGNADHVNSQFMTWPMHAQEKLDLKVKTVTYPLPPEEISEFRDWWGPCASFRLFLPEVLHDTGTVFIMLGTLPSTYFKVLIFQTSMLFTKCAPYIEIRW